MRRTKRNEQKCRRDSARNRERQKSEEKNIGKGDRAKASHPSTGRSVESEI